MTILEIRKERVISFRRTSKENGWKLYALTPELSARRAFPEEILDSRLGSWNDESCESNIVR